MKRELDRAMRDMNRSSGGVPQGTVPDELTEIDDMRRVDFACHRRTASRSSMTGAGPCTARSAASRPELLLRRDVRHEGLERLAERGRELLDRIDKACSLAQPSAKVGPPPEGGSRSRSRALTTLAVAHQQSSLIPGPALRAAF